MMPYIGDFVMIKENALIFHFMKMMKQPEFKKEEYWKFIISNQSLCLNLIPELEDKAFVSSCSKALEIYPFLKNAPQQNDTPDIVETKKMFAKSIKHRDVNDINKDETIDPPQKNDTKHHI